jgi:quercetin dioxygenase-like cupin family protein
MDTWPWPDSLDALVAAPEQHTLLLETDDVRVLDTRIRPGETVPVHTHRWPAVLYVLSTGHFVRRDGEGNVLVDTRGGEPIAVGAALWTEPLPPHTLENVSEGEIRVVNVELKRR